MLAALFLVELLLNFSIVLHLLMLSARSLPGERVLMLPFSAGHAPVGCVLDRVQALILWINALGKIFGLLFLAHRCSLTVSALAFVAHAGFGAPSGLEASLSW
jgi:hypothetical protein